MHWFHRHSQPFSVSRGPNSGRPATNGDTAAPPAWAPAEEPSLAWGIKGDAPNAEYEAAEDFCMRNPVLAPRLLSSAAVERIQAQGCKAWELAQPRVGSRFRGSIEALQSRKTGESKVIKVTTKKDCGDVCLMSTLPLMAGLYSIQGKEGVYYEITVLKMEGVIAIGTACLPYPDYRMPGWNRQSAGLHLDDFQKFFEDPDGGRHYDSHLQQIQEGDVVGCGYEFVTGSLFFTYNGVRLETAFRGIYLPRQDYDVYAAVGVGGGNELIVNFGGDDQERAFRWTRGREWGWRMEGHVGTLSVRGGSSSAGDMLPTYAEAG